MIRHMDISHFRAPYKNSMMGFGDVPLSPVESAVVDVDASGTRILKPAVSNVIMNSLGAFSVIVQGGDDAVSLAVAIPNDPREKADAWVHRKNAEGNVVYMGTMSGIPGIMAPVPPEVLQKFLRASPPGGTNYAAPDPAAGGVGPAFAVLSVPVAGGGVTTGGLTTAGVVATKYGMLITYSVVGIGAAAALYFIFRKKPMAS